jgi:hypothetical protein
MFSHHVDRAKMEVASFESGFPRSREHSRIANVIKSARVDIKKSENKTRTIGSGALAFATGASGFSKLPLIAKSQVILETLEHTQSSIKTLAVTAVVFGGWNKLASKAYDTGMKHYPRAVSTAKEEFPLFAETISESLPGFDTPSTGNYRPSGNQQVKRLGSQVSLHLRRGVTVEGIGIAPYIFSAHAQKKSPAQINRLATVASADGGVIAGTIAGFAAETMLRIEDSHPQLAENIDSTASDPRVLLGAAALLMASEFLANRRGRNEARVPA